MLSTAVKSGIPILVKSLFDEYVLLLAKVIETVLVITKLFPWVLILFDSYPSVQDQEPKILVWFGIGIVELLSGFVVSFFLHDITLELAAKAIMPIKINLIVL